MIRWGPQLPAGPHGKKSFRDLGKAHLDALRHSCTLRFLRQSLPSTSTLQVGCKAPLRGSEYLLAIPNATRQASTGYQGFQCSRTKPPCPPHPPTSSLLINPISQPNKAGSSEWVSPPTLFAGQVSEQGNRLDGFAEAHFVSQNAVEFLLVHGDQPVQANVLVFSQCPAQQVRNGCLNLQWGWGGERKRHNALCLLRFTPPRPCWPLRLPSA